MIFLYILAAIVIIFIILIHSPFKIYVLFNENKFSVTVKYLFFKKDLMNKEDEKDNNEKRKKKKKSAKKSAKKRKDKKKNENKKNKKKKSIFPKEKEEGIAFIINVLKASGKALKIFTKRITIKNIKANIDISDEDACECAVKFGKTNIAVYNIISFASCFFKVKKQYININCVYNKPKSVYNLGFTVKLTPFAGILSTIAFIFTFLVNNKRVKKQAESV